MENKTEKRTYKRSEDTNHVMSGHTCIGPECTKPAIAKFMCMSHYYQKRRGTPLRVIGKKGPRGPRSIYTGKKVNNE